MSAYIGLGITRGAKEVQKHEQGRAMREAQQAEATNRQKLSKMQLDDYNSPKQVSLRDQQTELMLAQTKQETRAANRQMLKNTTFMAFDKYLATGNTEVFNGMLADIKKNPVGAKFDSGIIRYDPLTDTPEIRRKMEEAGINDLDGVLADKKLSQSFVVTTGSDGQKTVWDVDKVMASSGFKYDYNERALKDAQVRAQTKMFLQKGNSVTEIDMKNRAVEALIKANPTMPYNQAYKEITEIAKSGSISGDSSMIREIAEEDGTSIMEATVKYYDAKNAGKGQTDQSRFIDSYMKDNPEATRSEASKEYKNLNDTASIKNDDATRAAKDKLDEVGYLDMDMENLTNQQKANIQREVATIMSVGGASLTTEDERVLRDLNALTSLGGKAGEELTDAETGLMDSFLNNVKKYLIDEVGGAEGTSSYHTFRNIIRNGLFGASLTNTEKASFDKAAGTLGERFQPVMQKLVTQMTTIKSKLETIANLKDPYVAKFYLGKSVSNIDDAIRQIESRIDLVSSYKTKGKVTTEDVMDESWKERARQALGRN